MSHLNAALPPLHILKPVMAALFARVYSKVRLNI